MIKSLRTKLRPIHLAGVMMLFGWLCALPLQAQTKLVSGVVKTDAGEVLPGVNVLEKGTTNGTVTDVDGKFSINASTGATLIFSFIGMGNQEILIGDRTQLDVAMATDLTQLDEVVVVGYGTQKRSDVTGSIASVSSKDIKSTPIASISQALQGRAAGVQVSQASNAPGGGVTIRIRGGNSIQGGNEPLYVVDGYPLYNEDGPNLSPNDIESMEILKDASATAIYGSRGANGVVIITTKRGKAGRNTVQFESYYGTQVVRKKLDMLNATELAQLVNEGIANVNADNLGKPGFPKAPTFTDAQIADLGDGTNWQDEIFRSAPMQNYQLTFAGGDDKMRYSISGNYFDQDGVVLNTGFQRGSVRINLDKNVNKRFKLSTSMTITRSAGNKVNTDGDGGGGAGVVYGALNFSPTVPVYNADGTYTYSNRPGAILISNPVALTNLTTDETTITRILGTVSGEYQILEGLSLKVLMGANIRYSKENFYQPRTVYAGGSGTAFINVNQNSEWLNENTLNYVKTFAERHHINVLAGYTTQVGNFESVRASAQNFGNDLLAYNDLSAAVQTNTSNSNRTKSGIRSYIGRVNYDFNERYLLTLTARIDGSSKFGESNKNAVFPSGSAAWRISKESFMSNVSKISDLKLRVSYGITGNQEIGSYASIGALSAYNTNFGNNLSIGYAPSRLANSGLRWETTAQTDIGIDIGLLNNRITITADWYRKKTDKLLYNVSLPTTTGFPTSLQNIGSVENQGVELGINTVNFDNELQWTTNFNISANKNKILDLGAVTGDIPAGSASGHLQLSNSGILRVGEQLGVFYGLETDGIFQNQAEIDASAQKTAKPGERRYKDVVPDGVINSSDRVILGHAQPNYIFGITNNLSYKGIDFSVFFQGVQGNSIFNINRYELESLTGISNQSAAVLDRWTPTNPSNEIPRASSTSAPYQVTSRQIEDGSYVRMKNIQIGYNLPSAWLDRVKLSSAKIYISGQNLWTITDYSGFDPEVSRYGQDNLSQGIDYGSYPTAKVYLIGLNIGF